MSGPALTPSHVKAIARKVLKKDAAARAIGIHSELPWVGPGELTVDERPLRVAWCPSVLSFREELLAVEADGPGLILITNQQESEIGLDALARVSNQRLLPPDPWQTVKDLFGARRADARLSTLPWMADLLIEIAPASGYPDAASGFLDLDRAWAPILMQLGFGSSRPDARAVLEWSTVPSHLALFRALAEPVRRDIQTRVEESAGAVGGLLVHAAATGRDGDAVALGLVIQVVFAVDGAMMGDSAVRLERYLGGRSLTPELAKSWSAMVEEHLSRPAAARDRERPGGVAERATTILSELRALDHVERSRWLPAGLAHRKARLSSALAGLLKRPSLPAVKQVEAAAQSLLDHRALAHAPEGERVVRMVERVARLLGNERESAASPSLAAAIHAYGQEGAFIDWARRVISTWGAQVLEIEVLRALHDRLLERRERDNQRFAALLCEARCAVAPDSGVWQIESLIGGVVAPLAENQPVLLIVLDGVSVPVMRELIATLKRTAWVELAPSATAGPERRPLLALAALPTITEVCRTSLLTGKLTRGGQGEERSGFREHPQLRKTCGPRHPPVLFHKADLADGIGNVSPVVTDAIQDVHHKVVGAVVNAVDDHLAKGDQVAVRWDLESLPVVARLIEAAQRSGRIVVLTSDHGHVIERECTHRPDDTGGDRWREAGRPPTPEELHLTGPRVLTGSGRGIVAPWSETIRYTSKKNGYHGGVSLQEAVVPAVVLTCAATPPANWVELPDSVPPWWVHEVPPAPGPVQPQLVTKNAKSATAPTLFNYQAPAPSTAGEAVSWIDRLLAAELFREQSALAQRAAVPEERMRRLLTALAERGGKISLVALARALDLPAIRLTGVLASVRRILNIDGYPVISVEDDEVVLNRELLVTQFEIEEA